MQVAQRAQRRHKVSQRVFVKLCVHFLRALCVMDLVVEWTFFDHPSLNIIHTVLHYKRFVVDLGDLGF